MGSSVDRQRAIAKILAVAAAAAWGISGNFAQFAFARSRISPEWLVSLRLLISGVVLLLVAQFTGKKIFSIWKDRTSAMRLFIFGCIGMLGVQYTYLAAIEASNAATATVLQYLGPVFIAAYYSWVRRQLPTRIEVVAITLAVLGTALMVTHGNVSSLAITPTALVLGLASAVTLAIYSVQPVPLLRDFDSVIVVGWGMLIGGIVLSLFRSPFMIPQGFDFSAFVAVAFIVLIGSLFAFYAYLNAVRVIGASTASLLACAEPLSAALVAVGWMDVKFTTLDWIGAILIVSTITLLSVADRPS